LTQRVGDENAFQVLRRRSLLSADEDHNFFALHQLIADLTLKRCLKQGLQLEDEHVCVADNWLSGVRKGVGVSVRNVIASSEASYHLLEAGRYDRLD